MCKYLLDLDLTLINLWRDHYCLENNYNSKTKLSIIFSFAYIFMQFSAKDLQNNPIWELTHPPLENPGSATEEFQILVGFAFVMVTPTDITS